ncbi:MAG: GNAT family N-acetyltransferase, partial [Parvularculaceae bacterium]|nr:GNAT family N-acetyltransferase [Parvularculaceae bacterium]
MHQHIWAVSAAETFTNGGRAVVYCVGDRAKPRALAAFAESISASGRTLRLLGAEETGESAPIAYTDDAALASLACSLRASGAALRLAHYPSEDAFVAALGSAYRGRGALALRPVPWRASPRITLDASWTSPDEKLSSGRRSDLRRMRRAAEKEGAVGIEFLAPGAADVGGPLEEALAVESAGWKARAGTSILKNNAAERFFRAYALRAARAGILRIAL